ncbi:bifunctional purine biosynthesis protein PURH [Striga asiatica]|uniref:Bifunctional purine biosynthesis protein PURH n=1 Tax=Striga asiatica TaxID=4170 RepID=A0A5A7PTS0_STRAF|nr:bifunctional purine biosynthesis protein PURH [Striga asiatica]
MDISSFLIVHLLQHTAGVDSHRTRSRRRTAVASRRSPPLIVSSPSADTTPCLSPPPARRLVYVSRIDASSPSTRTYLRLRPSQRRNAIIHRRPPPRRFISVSRRVTSPPRRFGSMEKTLKKALALGMATDNIEENVHTISKKEFNVLIYYLFQYQKSFRKPADVSFEPMFEVDIRVDQNMERTKAESLKKRASDKVANIIVLYNILC